ncbi:probable Probable 1,4-beta-D-glucan cellobiohydrolase B [Rhynchosporium secalis]|uniref:Glucanase n=1 Tax=Rhynchosporium secalis TaxID=38038 RepID=A0A1E1M242_RHYSE|nr:probable Probable 1,4-beta-D-glucan cellobiohydrolase B [Rhynchosporium secalis]
MSSRIALASLLLSVASAQQVGTLTPEVHPPLTWQTCTAYGSCTTIAGKVVLDHNWRWLHSSTGTNCYTGNTWNPTFCPTNTACATNCQLDGADYSGTYGATTTGNALRLNFVTQGANRNVGSRLFLMADDSNYQMLSLLNKEFTFDVDVSHLPCGLNGALYLVSMAKDGGASLYPGNKAGAKYGTGYCDAQCPRDLKFINGEANVEGWKSASNSADSGYGGHGSCCAEMDIWEANSISTALTPHSSDPEGQTMCLGDACGGTYSPDRYVGVTDPDGCDFNSYRQGNKEFYGPGKTVNTNSVFTVVTQFITDTGTDAGTLSEIKRFYVQGGVVIPNSQSTIAGLPGNSLTDKFCKDQKKVFGDQDIYNKHGGFASMSKALKAGMVLTLSLWDDYASNMLWLDSDFPIDADPSALGVGRGSCARTTGNPVDVEKNSPNSYVIYSNIKVGALNSTFNAGSVVTPPGGTTSRVSTSTTRKPSSSTLATSTTSKAPTTSSAAPPAGSGAAHFQQCGGQPPFAGPFTCVAPYKCTYSSPYYSQCL